MKHPQFENEHFYHIYNRGVEKRDIFIDKNDYLRFLEGLKEFNNPEMVTLRDPPPYRGLTSVRKKLVRIHAFCLMPNHFHLLLEQIADNGIPLFMQKLGTGYTMYFNLVNQRVGGLFQGTFKAKIIENETYLMHLLRYIHLNPIELVEAKWKEKGIAWKKVKKILDNTNCQVTTTISERQRLTLCTEV